MKNEISKSEDDELIAFAMTALKEHLQSGGPEVDWMKLLWFEEGLLDSSEAQKVRGYLLTWRDWYNARIELLAELNRDDV